MDVVITSLPGAIIIPMLAPPKADGAKVVRSYFDLWNERKMEEAVELFSDNCTYEDTLYPEVFQGKEQLRAHLLR